MKKLIAIALVVLMLIPFAACGTTNNNTTPDEAAPTTSAPTTTANSTTPAPVVDPNGATRGKVVNYIYTNTFSGVTFNADNTWNFYPDSSLAALYGITEDALKNENLQTTITGNGAVYDVYAQKVTKDILEASFSLTYINGNDAFVKDMSVEEFVDTTAASTGIDVATAKTDNVAYGGRTFCRITSETNEKTVIIAACRINNVIVMINAFSTKDSTVNFAEILK